MLEFWRILSLKIFKILHDEFVYDESLKSYHNHIYMLIRLWTIFTFYCLWALSVVKLCRPLGACHAVKIKIHLHVHSYMLLLLRKYASTYIHSFPSPDSPNIILLLIWERIAKNISLFLFFPVKLMLELSWLLPLAILFKEMSALKKGRKDTRKWKGASARNLEEKKDWDER